MTTRSQTQTKATPVPSVTPVQKGLLQRKCSCGAGASTLAGECEECRKKKMMGLQAKLRVNEPGDIYEQEADRVAEQVLAKPAHPDVRSAPLRIQRFPRQSSGQMDAAPASVDRAIASAGRPLEPALRQDMESRFGHDFSTVRVHSGAAAEQSARDVNAHAYTVGHDIVFGAGRFAPATHEGRRLIAHELAHVVQQSGATGMPAGGVAVQRAACRCKTRGRLTRRLVKQGKWCRDSEKSGEPSSGSAVLPRNPLAPRLPIGQPGLFRQKNGQVRRGKPGFRLSPFPARRKMAPATFRWE